jgi:putative transcriptional regulator
MGSRVAKLYHYRDCGLDNVYLDGGYEVIKSPYGESVAIHDLDGLHRCIGFCLVDKPAALTGAEFRFLRTELDLSQSAMGAFCGREERMIRNWETRNGVVDEPANTIVRFVYKERFDAKETFEGFAKHIRDLQSIDKKLHELKLEVKATESGWTSRRTRAVAA